MEKIRVLFVCTHNSGRSQMAEIFLNALGQGRFEAESTGLGKRHSWPFPDSSKVEGAHEERLVQVRKIRDDIKSRVESWIQEIH